MPSIIVTFFALVLAASEPVESNLPSTFDLTKIRSITVQHDGRWMPLDTAARDIVNSITGQEFYTGHDPVLMLLAWTSGYLAAARFMPLATA